MSVYTVRGPEGEPYVICTRKEDAEAYAKTKLDGIGYTIEGGIEEGYYNVIDSVWFGNIGIVRVRLQFGDDKFYIGSGHGHNKEADEQHIAEWGLPYHPQALEGFFDVHK